MNQPQINTQQSQGMPVDINVLLEEYRKAVSDLVQENIGLKALLAQEMRKQAQALAKVQASTEGK